MLGFLHGLILLAGVGAAELLHLARVRAAQVAVALVLVAGGLQLGWQAWRASLSPAVERDEPTLAGKMAQGFFRGRVDIPFAASPQNPYVYAQTLPGILPLVERVKGLAKVSPDGNQMLVKVAAPDSQYWPLPWYLRELKRVWWVDTVAGGRAPVMVISPAFRAYLDEATGQRWRSVGFYQMRPGWPGYPGVFFELYVESELWVKYVDSLRRSE
jgi:predicted membrane-bound mannosyltransferase